MQGMKKKETIKAIYSKYITLAFPPTSKQKQIMEEGISATISTNKDNRR